MQEVADLSELRTGSLTIGSSRTRTACFLIDPLVAFHRQYPGIQLAIKEAPVRTLEEYVASGTVDFALLYGSSLRPDFTSVALCREHTMLAVPKAHSLARAHAEDKAPGFPRISFAAMSGEPFIRLQPTRQMAEVYEKLCESSGAKPQVIFEANSIIEASELCAAGLGATLVTDMLVQRWRWKEQAFFFELEEEVEDRQLLAVCSKQRFIDFLRAD